MGKDSFVTWKADRKIICFLCASSKPGQCRQRPVGPHLVHVPCLRAARLSSCDFCCPAQEDGWSRCGSGLPAVACAVCLTPQFWCLSGSRGMPRAPSSCPAWVIRDDFRTGDLEGGSIWGIVLVCAATPWLHQCPAFGMELCPCPCPCCAGPSAMCPPGSGERGLVAGRWTGEEPFLMIF